MPPKKHPRPVESDHETTEDEISNTCRGCKKTLTSLGWLEKHLDRSKTNCKNKYSKEEFQSLGPKNEARKKKRKVATNAENYQEKKEKKSQWYQENKGKRAKWYQENKEKIALKYQENKEKIALKYQGNKEKIAQRYQEKKEEVEDRLTS